MSNTTAALIPEGAEQPDIPMDWRAVFQTSEAKKSHEINQRVLNKSQPAPTQDEIDAALHWFDTIGLQALAAAEAEAAARGCNVSELLA